MYDKINKKLEEGLQNYRNDCQELPIMSELFAIIYLLPPSQPIVDTLIFCKGSPLLPVKKLICDLNIISKVLLTLTKALLNTKLQKH